MGYLRQSLLMGLLLAVPAYSQTCSLTATPQNIVVVPGGAATTITVTLSNQGCAWAAIGSNSDWIIQTSSKAATAGNGTVAFTILANPNPISRTGTITLVLLGGTTVNFQAQILQLGTITTQLFNDVPDTDAFVNYVNPIRTAGITNGCSLFPPLFCPTQTVTRGQMAVFIVRAAIGSDNFSYPNLPYFDDVNQNHPFFKYIQKLRELAITSGCSATPALFCPDADVSRLQMAIFLMRGKFGTVTANTALHSSVVPYFTDVATESPEFPFIQKMKDFGITSGCTTTQYCPSSPVSRAQTAVFLTRLFLTPFSLF